MEYEFVGRAIDIAVETLDTLGSRAVVARGLEEPASSPAALVEHLEREVLGQFRGTVVL